jgi:hypothetical protein
MTLKEAFHLVPNEFRGHPAVVYLGNKALIGGMFCSIIDFPLADRYFVLSDRGPFEMLSDREGTLIFRVKE